MNEKNINNDNNIKKIFKGSVISILVTVVLLLIYSLLLSYTGISENTMTTVTIIITIISILIGSTVSMLNSKKNGIINGALIGIIYVTFIYLLSSIIEGNFALNIKSIIMIISSIIAGSLGGIIAVNKS